MFLQVAAAGKRLVAVLACVRVSVGGGHGVRRAVDRRTVPAVGRGAAVRGRVVLRHGRTPRRSGLFGAHFASAAQRFCNKPMTCSDIECYNIISGEKKKRTIFEV